MALKMKNRNVWILLDSRDLAWHFSTRKKALFFKKAHSIISMRISKGPYKLEILTNRNVWIILPRRWSYFPVSSKWALYFPTRQSAREWRKNSKKLFLQPIRVKSPWLDK